MSKYKTYYIRHKMAVEKSTKDDLWKKSMIAIHLPWKGRRSNFRRPDSRSLNPSHYAKRGAKQALDRLWELANNGGYVCAEYEGTQECLLGFVPPKSKVKLLPGKWEPAEVPNRWRSDTGRTAILKTLALHKVKKLRTAELAAALVGRPQQGTISRWRIASEKRNIEHIVRGKRPSSTALLDMLLPPQQEVMCGEFLRTREAKKAGLPRMAHLLLPVGRTMKDIDIYGATGSGERIFAQVTHGKLEQSATKLRRLRAYGTQRTDHLILFCGTAKRDERDGVVIVPLEYVYAKFARTKAGRLWRRDVLRAYS